MKALIAFTLTLFASASLAGSVGNGSFESYTTSDTYTEVEGFKSSAVYGDGTAVLVDGLNSRTEVYARDEYTVTEFDGFSHSSRDTVTFGTSQGLVGHSQSASTGYTHGDMDSTTYVDNVVSGDYVEVSIGLGGINHESGYFEDLEQSTSYSDQDYETDSYSESSSSYTVW